ncbi:PAAR domain-containing protein [Burkholderia pyrrocinia]|uniref:PAAR domain-containing protein n=1 Tax=Burkholderia TaxID=32008 RepID=UPI001588EDB7|nr:MULTISPECIES: PAAR domain-containing protein [Burkholderia]EKS9883527.1 PAAR domain-containing protein [Burkholderia pyrrocinia]EKS9893223.1 PAAR domain-containing protein [Burkholderia pyrrocinia]EKS9909081.1 PAAR domain-containing protein [Burkholderia pyrrocinia]UOB57236.1 PAAR domain-containing protein [Burkholderia pyrrocinia]
MSRRAVRNGDPTTTGGVVIAVTSTMFNHGKQVAQDGDKATCGNCEGTFPIVGGAQRMIHHGRRVALEGDAVLCPCGQNRLIAGSDSTIFYGGDGGHNAANPFAARSTYAPTRHAPGSGIHDDQFVIRDVRTKQPLSNVRYWIKDRSGTVLASGVSDRHGCTARVQTEYAQTLKLVIED